MKISENRRDARIKIPGGEIHASLWRDERLQSEDRAPVLMFHESLGCARLWRGFPERLSAMLGRTVIAYDRLGFGQSTPHPGGWSTNFIRDEAELYVPQILDGLGIGRFIAFGHSVGGAMGVLTAARFPDRCLAVITESAQAFVEDLTISGIREAAVDFENPDLRAKLRKYHGDKTDWVLSAWIDTWLSPEFGPWRLEESTEKLSVPILAMHGERDEYGTDLHPRIISSLTTEYSRADILENCRHSPHLEREELIAARVKDFIDEHVAPREKSLFG